MRSINVSNSLNNNGDLWVPVEKLSEYTGLQLKPEGVCTENTCIPLPSGQEGKYLLKNEGLFNISAFSRRMGEQILHDSKHDVWVISEPSTHSNNSSSMIAPNFTLPDYKGIQHSLKSFLGKKIFLVSWATW